MGFLKSPHSKGWGGENLLKSLLSVLPTDQYKTFHNVTLATPDGSTQIDHVVISVYGVFVIETKNMTGWIFGAKDQSQWTQIIYEKKVRFRNPLRQNYKHTLSLANTLDIPLDHVFSIIAFVGDSTFRTTMPPNVTYRYDCVRYIKQHQQELFSREDVSSLVDLLEQKRLAPGAETQRQHVEHVQNIAVNKTVCTRCGKPMVERVAKKGANAGQTFLGCSGYPNCKNTVELPS
jgi:restriction system protein